MTPSISIIIATYNAATPLLGLLESLTSQDIDDAAFEVILVDGGSSDGTVDLMRAADLPLAGWVSEADEGIYDAWNKGLQLAQGEWLVFLGADDLLAGPDTLSRILPELQRAAAEDIAFVYGRVVLVDPENGQTLRRVNGPWEEARRSFPRFMSVIHCGMFHHRSVFAAGGFDTSFAICGDYDLCLRELIVADKAARFIDQDTVRMADGGVSAANRHRLRVAREIRRAHRKQGIRGVWLSDCRKLCVAATTQLGSRVIGERLMTSLRRRWGGVR